MRFASLALLLVAACQAGPRAPAGAAPAEHTAALSIPPGPRTRTALDALGHGTRADDAQRLVYLIELWDDARWVDRAASRALLLAALGLPETAAAPAVIDALVLAADRILERDRLDPSADAARTLLAADRGVTSDDRRTTLVALKRLARSGGPLAPAAALRLADYCHAAMIAAMAAPLRDRARFAAHCLYVTHATDPAPYLDPNANARPPAPDPVELAGLAREQLGAAPRGRSAAAIEAARAALDADADGAAHEIPRLPSIELFGLPAVAGAPAYDGEPLLDLGDGEGAPGPKQLAQSLTGLVGADDRSAVAALVAGHAPAALVLTAGRAAAQAGARELDVIVPAPVILRAPPGDYWHGKITGDRALRPALLPLSLAALGARASGGTPRASDWDPARASLGLHLIVGKDAWRLLGTRGALAEIPSTGDPAAALRAKLAEVRAAFADEDGLVLVPGEGTSVAALIGAAAAAQRATDGGPVTGRLALGATAPTPRAGGALAAQIARRAAATVVVDPPALASRLPSVRGCYQLALERRASLAGEVRVERATGEASPSAHGPAPLRGCAERLISAMAESGIDRAVVRFAPRP